MTLPMNRLGLTIMPVVVVVAITLTAFTNIATAQITADQQSAIRSSCRSDFMSKCSGVTPGGKDALACLKKNVASLAPACKTAVSATMPAQAAPAPAAAQPPTPAAAAPPPAEAPAEKPAVVAAPPPGAAPAPAPKRAAAPAPKPASPTKTAAPVVVVAPAPVVVVAPPPPPPGLVPGAALITKACGRSLILHCRGVEPGGGREIACLKAQMAAGKFIGPRCRAALEITSTVR